MAAGAHDAGAAGSTEHRSDRSPDERGAAGAASPRSGQVVSRDREEAVSRRYSGVSRSGHARATRPPRTEADQPPALVLGSGITVLGVVRALGRAGVPLHVLSPRPGSVRASRWYAGPPHGQYLEEHQDLAAYLRTLPLERGVPIPTSDHDVLSSASLPPDLAERFPTSQASQPLLRQLLDKERLRELLDTHAVPRPRTIAVSGPDELDALDDDEIDGLFVKPRDSQAFNRRLHVKALWADGREELKRALALAQGEGLAVVLQEYIPGPPTNHYFLDGFVDRTGRVRGRMARRRLRMSEPHFGNSCATVSVPLREVAPAAANLERLFAAVGYRGPYDAEFKLDERTGVFHLVEINVRPWWQIEFAALCGLDAATMVYRDALGLPVADVTDYALGVRWVLPYHDVAACARSIASGEARLGECLRSWASSRWGGFAADDPLPGLAEGASLLGRVAQKGASRLLSTQRATGPTPARPRVPSP